MLFTYFLNLYFLHIEIKCNYFHFTYDYLTLESINSYIKLKKNIFANKFRFKKNNNNNKIKVRFKSIQSRVIEFNENIKYYYSKQSFMCYAFIFRCLQTNNKII